MLVSRTSRVAVVAAVMAAAAASALIAVAPPAAAASGVRISRVVYDPTGSDTRSNAQLVREYVVVKNFSRVSKSLTGWTLRDRNGYVYRFPTTRLASGGSVVVHTGRGTDAGRHRYWNRGWYVWNNTGDTAYLRNSVGGLEDRCGWGDGNGVQAC